MYTHDEMIDIVSAANIAGHMEHSGKICLSDDEELLNTILKEMKEYNDKAEITMGCSNGINWYDHIEAALIREYGVNG